jgi:hypothetical protein
MKSIDASQGLLVAKQQFQKTYMAEQCRQLTADLDRAIEVTTRDYVVRSGGYLIERDARNVSRREDRLERGLHTQFGAQGSKPVPGAWHRIIAYQVPLSASQDSGWGKIDLLGLDQRGLPIVIELKSEGADEVPAALVVQAAAYGIALRKAWPRFRHEWRPVVRNYWDESVQLPTILSPCPLLCIAPESYWKTWGTSWKSIWAFPLLELVSALYDRGLPLTFASLTGDFGSYVITPFQLQDWLTAS